MSLNFTVDCQDFTLDVCNGNPPFYTFSAESVEDCQWMCNYMDPQSDEDYDWCTFFVYNRAKKKDNCHLHDYNMKNYTVSCNIMAGPPIPSLDYCRNLNDDCLVSVKIFSFVPIS